MTNDCVSPVHSGRAGSSAETSSISFSIALRPFSRVSRCAGCLARSNCWSTLDLESSNDRSRSCCSRDSGETLPLKPRSLREFPSSIWSATALLSQPRAILISQSQSILSTAETIGITTHSVMKSVPTRASAGSMVRNILPQITVPSLITAFFGTIIIPSRMK